MLLVFIEYFRFSRNFKILSIIVLLCLSQVLQKA